MVRALTFVGANLCVRPVRLPIGSGNGNRADNRGPPLHEMPSKPTPLPLLILSDAKDLIPREPICKYRPTQRHPTPQIAPIQRIPYSQHKFSFVYHPTNQE